MAERPLVGKTAWVTGASRGIGRAIALELARAGAVVCLGARSEDALNQLVEILKAEELEAHAIPVDVGDNASVEQFALKAIDLAGPPHILVNNAGVAIRKEFLHMDPADFDSQIDVTLKGPWYMAKAAAPAMQQLGGGFSVNISSIAGRHPFKRGTGYCAAKAGLNSFSEALMLELRDFGIKVFTIAPGSVDTSFHQTALPQQNPKDNSWMLDPETIAESVLHLITQPPNALTNYYEIRPMKKGK